MNSRTRRPPVPAVALALAALVVASACAEELDGRFVPIEEVRPGDRCVGLTVFSGTEVEEFAIEILGVVRGTAPGTDLIIGRAEGEILERTGIMEGMSGSPVYRDGRLVGAVASTWQFIEEPIAGITPIGEMLPALERLEDDHAATPRGDGGFPGAPLPTGLIPVSEREMSAALGLAAAAGLDVRPRAAPEVEPVRFGDRQLSPIAAPLVVSGASDAFLRAASNALGPGVAPMAGAGVASAGGGDRAAALEPGSAVGVQFVRGDVNWTAIGTVTHVDGDRLVAFGHSLFNSGEFEMPMVSAHVHALMPIQSLSFKYATGGELLGKMIEDRNRAVAGVMGPAPDMVPVRASVRGGGGAWDFEFDVVRGRPYTAVFGGMAVGGAVSSAVKSSGPAGVSLVVRLDVGGETVEYRDVFHTSAPSMRIAGELSMLMTVLLENAFEDVALESVEVELDVREGELWTAIERVDADRTVYAPGEPVRLRVRLRPRRGEPLERELVLRLPDSVPDGPLVLRVGDATSFHLWEQERLGPGRVPRSLSQLLELVRTARSGNTVVAQLLSEAPGFSLSGEEMRAVPGRAGLAMVGSATGGAVDAAPMSVVSQDEFAIETQALGYFEMIVHVARER